MISACSRGKGKGRQFEYQGMKKRWSGELAALVEQEAFTVGATHFTFLFLEPRPNRDPDNILGGAMKLMFDALQDNGTLADDGWEQVESITAHFALEKRCSPGVLVAVAEAPATKQQMMELKEMVCRSRKK